MEWHEGTHGCSWKLSVVWLVTTSLVLLATCFCSVVRLFKVRKTPTNDTEIHSEPMFR